MTGLSVAALAGWAPWLVPLLVIVALALCVLRSRRQQRQRRRRQRELANAGRGGMAAGVPASSLARPGAVTLSSAVPPTPPAAATVTSGGQRTAPSTASAAVSAASSPSAAAAGTATQDARAAGRTPDPTAVPRTGREAGRREVEALEALRGLEFGDREEGALQAQLARAPRDVGALFGLLQWHARRGERVQVESFAHALWDETDAEGELWRRAAALGRSVDPTNPLYSDDPFTALAEHAARQPARAPLALAAFDLSLPEAGVSPLPPASKPGEASDRHLPPIPDQLDSLSETVRRSALRDHAAYEGAEVPHAPGGPPVEFDFLNAPSARLPASFTGLDLNLNLDLDLDLDPDKPARPAAPAAAAPRKTSDRRRNRGKGSGPSDA
ncbi:MAG: hypothetical protein ACRYHA_19675 [Janthinobacterium lividum]